MNENVENLNQPVSGEVLIQKFDANGNKIFEQGGKNAIKSLVGYHAKRAWRSAFSAYCPNPSYESSIDSYDSRDFARYMYLVNSPDAYNADFPEPVIIGADTCPVFPLMDRAKSYIGYVNRYNQSIGSNTQVGIINYSESYCTPEKAVFVYDFTSANAVGTFDTIVHTNSCDINNPDYQNYYKQDGVTVANRNWTPAGVYCFYIEEIDNKEYQFVIHNPRQGSVGYETELWLDSVNMETGIITKIVLPNASNTNGIVCNWNGSRMVIVLRRTGTSVLVYESNNPTGTYTKILTDTGGNDGSFGGYYGLAIDETYLYLQNSNQYMYRWNHTTPSVLTTNNVKLGDFYTFIVGNKIYKSNTAEYFEMPIEWTGQTLTPKIHKYGYPDIGFAGGSVFGEYFYWNSSFKTYVTNEGYDGPYSFVDKYAFCRCKITDYRQVESVHYKHSVPITKGANETMKITYTFNFS